MSKTTLSNEEAYELAAKLERIGGNVLACYVTPASASHQEPSLTVIVETTDREIYPVYPIKVTWLSIHNSKEYYMDKWGEAWYTFYMMDYMKTREYKQKQEQNRSFWVKVGRFFGRRK